MQLSASSEFIQKHGVDFNKTAIDDHLDFLAKQHARTNSVPYIAAYKAVLDTPEGQSLYAGYKAAPVLKREPETPTPMVRKSAKAAAIEGALDALAKQHMKQTGESFAKSYAAILETEAGRVAYSELRAA